jgi:hypothetical protein
MAMPQRVARYRIRVFADRFDGAFEGLCVVAVVPDITRKA